MAGLLDILSQTNPNSSAVSAPAQAGFGLQTLAPNIASLLTGQLPLALPNFPETPGKVPSTNDPRIGGAIVEALNFLPVPGMALASGTGRGILGLLRRAAASEAESLASKSPMMYNPPVKSSRPFAADYPSGAPADAAGRLTRDIEGRPLTAQYIVGRRTLGGADEAISPAELDALAEKILGNRPALVPAKALPRGSVGAYDPNTRRTLVYRGRRPRPRIWLRRMRLHTASTIEPANL
jgi:hypothetical protein